MTHYRRILAALALAGGVGVTGIALAQPAPSDAPPPPDAEPRAEAPAMPMGPMGGPEGRFHGPRGPRIDFAAIDANGDGVLTREELSERAAGRLAGADGNGDGALDRDELIAALPGPRDQITNVFAPNPAEMRADRLIAFMGASDAGQFQIRDFADRQVNAVVAKLDRDHDGSISQAEAAPKGKPHRHPHGDDGGPGDARGDGRGDDRGGDPRG